MSAYSQTIIQIYEIPSCGAAGMFRKLLQNGWGLQQVATVSCEDRYDWVPLQCKAGYGNLIAYLESMEVEFGHCGVWLIEPARSTTVSVHVFADDLKVEFGWSADSPHHPDFPRAVDPAWALQVVKIFCDVLDIRVESLEYSVLGLS